MSDILTLGAALAPQLLSLYRALHRRPEIAFQEHETARRLAAELAGAGFEVRQGIGRTGLAGVLENGPGKILMLRTDMDALGIREQSGVEFASNACFVDSNGIERPLMHACGHDLHMAAFIGAAQMLNGPLRDQWSGTLLMIAQPAEELLEGARAMLDDPAFAALPQPAAAFTLHCASGLPVGKLLLHSGEATTGREVLELHAKVKQGRPDDDHSVDAWTVLGYTLSRVPALDPRVTTPRLIWPLRSYPVAENEAVQEFTVRVENAQTVPTCEQQLKEAAAAVAAYFELAEQPTVRVLPERATPPVINDEQLAQCVLPGFRAIFGRPENVRLSSQRPSVAEDFSLFGERLGIPLLRWCIGTSSGADWDPDRPNIGHRPWFLPEYQRAIPLAAASFAAAALAFFGD